MNPSANFLRKCAVWRTPGASRRLRRWTGGGLVAAVLAVTCGCGGAAPEGAQDGPEIVPVYDRDTGWLAQMTTDRNGDGKTDTWAYLTGRRLDRIEIDRDGDGEPDRIEYYEVPEGADTRAAFGGALIVRAEESSGPGTPVTRREFYEGGVLSRVEEDTDGDGRPDRWEQHENGSLLWLAFDTQKRGTPDRRLYYGRGGARAEVDPDGDGVFEPAPTP